MAMTSTDDLGAAATTAYELNAYFALRANTLYSSDEIAKVQATRLTHRGSTVKFWFYDDLATATAALTEETDVTAGAASDTSVDVTITEYGAATGSTVKMIGTDMLEFDTDVAQLNARQLADSYELLARTAVLAGTNVIYGGDAVSTVTVAAGDPLTAAMVREGVGRMRAANAQTVANEMYIGMVSPYQSIDLRTETGDAAWIPAQNYQNLVSIQSGHIGAFGGAMFIESSRVAGVGEADGAASIDVHKGHLIGREALARAYSMNVSAPTPQVRVSPVTDKLQRFRHIGWYWLGGFKVFREAALYRLETSTSVN